MAHDLNKFSLRDLVEACASLRKIGTGAANMEEAANRVVHYLHDNLLDGACDRKACAMVRFFKTHPWKGLEIDLQRLAQDLVDKNVPSAEMRCLTLLASAGENPVWNDRKKSRGHRVIPLVSVKAVAEIPMISSLVKQFGIGVVSLIRPDPALLLDLTQRTFNVFLVPDAVGSSYIPAQRDFVVPYGIQSVLGFGGVFPSGDLFAIIVFSKVKISRETAELFKMLALSVKIAVLPFENAVFSAPRRTGVEPLLRDEDQQGDVQRQILALKSEVAALDQLLGVGESTVLDQAERLEAAMQVMEEDFQKISSVHERLVGEIIERKRVQDEVDGGKSEAEKIKEDTTRKEALIRDLRREINTLLKELHRNPKYPE